MQQSATHTHLAKASDHSLTRDYKVFFPQLESARLWISGLLFAAVASCGLATAQTAGSFAVTNIMSDGFVPAPVTDPGFTNPWGVTGGKTLWISANGSGTSFVTSIAGVIAFKAIIPPASGTGQGSPTGTVQNGTTGFLLSNGAKASFLFSTLDGTISGWNGAQSAGGNHALIAVNNNAKNAVYTDLALVTNTTGTFLLAPNFGQGGNVEVYDTTFKPATLAGAFLDPNIPAGYAPYAIKSIGTQVLVTYMLRTVPPFTAGAGSYREILGTNTGFVSVFDVNGNFVARAVTGGDLNAPWGVAIAPAGFGIYSGDLLIGNFGDGLITAYNPTTYAYLGLVADSTGKAIANPGLWEIFATTATGDPTALYFTAGLAQETHGLFGAITNVTNGTGAATFNLSASSQVASVSVGSSTTMIISVAPTNSFTGTVTLTCSNLPSGATCGFSPASLTVSATAPATSTLTLQTASGSRPYVTAELRGLGRRGALGIGFALMLPFGSLLVRRRGLFAGLRILVAVAVLFLAANAIVGCAYTPSMMATPVGTSNVTVTATAGSNTQTTIVALTVK
jgi:uncharacterized protein (TIGR03118 family)